MTKIREFGAGDRAYVQAQRIWLILAGFVSGWTRKADDPTTITYGQLAVAMGLGPRAGRTLGPQLGIVGWCCIENGLPALNSIVVNDTTGAPGDWVVLSEGNSVEKEQRAVFEQDWYAIGVPTTGMLRKVWEELPYRD